jgi:2-keto-4-pentenoate hydratase
MPTTFDASRAARFLADAHAKRAEYRNLDPSIAPSTVEEAYAAQDALRELWVATKGPVAGYKIATTTRVMQELMGIDHPCCGNIFAKTVHASPARLRLADHMHVVVECELAVRLGRDAPKTGKAYTAGTIRPAIASVMPAFELIEDRRAHYKSSKALSLIADNAWNAGIVPGKAVDLGARMELDGLQGRLSIDGEPGGSGKTDDPLGALAWVANLAVSRGRPLQAGQIIMTGSVIATLPIEAGQTFRFEIEGLGETLLGAS